MYEKALIERFETLKARKQLLSLKRVNLQDHDDWIKGQIDQAQKELAHQKPSGLLFWLGIGRAGRLKARIERLKDERVKNLKALEGVLKEMKSLLKELDKLLAALEWNPENN